MHQSAIDQNHNNRIESTRIQSSDIATMSQDLFSSMLGMKLDLETNATSEAWIDPVFASIQIKGDWNAEFRVVAPMQLASQIGCAMFGMESDELSYAEVFDAMGEIVNVIGGNAKGIIDGDCQLSLPSVGLTGSDSEPAALSLTFACAGVPMNIQLVERQSTPTPPTN